MRKNYLNSLNSSIDSAINKVGRELAFAVQKVHAIDDRNARVAILVEPVHQKYITEEAMAVAIDKQFAGTRYQPNSLHRLSDTDSRIFGVFVARNDRVMSMEHANAMIGDNTMAKVNDTVYQDDKDDIWTVQVDGEHSYLVSQVDNNIADLIGGLKVRALANATVGLSMEEDFGPGHVVKYYDPAHAEQAFGIALDGVRVYNVDRDTIQQVEAASVIAVDDKNRFNVEVPQGEVASSKADLLEYMRKLYGHSPEFFAEIKEIINKHVSV